MSYRKDKIDRMEKHLLEHTADYQTKLSLFHAKSDEYKWEMKNKYNMGMKNIAEIRRKRNEKCT